MRLIVYAVMMVVTCWSCTSSVAIIQEAKNSNVAAAAVTVAAKTQDKTVNEAVARQTTTPRRRLRGKKKLVFTAPPTQSPVPAVQADTSTTFYNAAWGVPTSNLDSANITTRKIIIVDLDTITRENITQLINAGHIVQCHFSVGMMESWRADVQEDPAIWQVSTVANVAGTPGARWMDLTHPNTVQALMSTRFVRAAAMGCQAVELSDVDCYDHAECWRAMGSQAYVTGLQIKYNQWQVAFAHELGLAVSLRNAQSLIPDIGSLYDWAINEGCFSRGGCDDYIKTFVHSDKAVLVQEYGMANMSKYCKQAMDMKLVLAQCPSVDGRTCTGDWVFCDDM